MKDFDTWFYVIAFVFYIVAQIVRGYKKSKSKNAPAKQPRQTPQQQRKVAMPVEGQMQPMSKKRRKKFSFDDLLKEFEQSFEEKKPPVASHNIPEQKIVDKYAVPVSTERKLDEYGYPIYETENKHNAVVENEKQELVFSRDAKFKIEEKVENPYARILKEPDGLKKAVVLSEILNKKYF